MARMHHHSQHHFAVRTDYERAVISRLGVQLLRAMAALALCLPVAAAPTPAPGERLPAGISKITSVEGVDEYRLSNGMQLLLIPDDSKPSTTVNMTYKVGSRHENYGETGMAHLLEHLLFKGTPTTQNLLGEFSKRGLRANGSTWLDRTNYFASFSANDANLQWYLSWPADAMQNSNIARKDLDTEMTVVRNEMERGENSAGRILFERVMAAAYQWHNYGKNTIGARSDVEGVDIGRLQNFYRAHYRPDNAALIVSGKFDQPKVLTLVDQYFGKLRNPKASLPKLYTLDPAQDGERSVSVRRVGGTPSLYALYHVPPGAHPDYAAVSALTVVLGDTPSGRLHRLLVEKQPPLAAEAFAFSQALHDPGFAIFGLSLGPDQALEPARTALLATVEGVVTEPVTAEELERAKRKLAKDWDLSFTNPEQVGVALSEFIALGDWRLYFRNRDVVRALTLEDLNRVARSYLLRDNRTLGSYLPTDTPQRAPAPANVDVAALLKGYAGDAAASQAEAFDATPTNIDRRSQAGALPVGLQTVLLAKGARGRLVNGALLLQFGDERSLLGQSDVASAVAAMLDKGTTSLSRNQIQDKLDLLRAELGFSGDATGLRVGLRSTRENLPALIALMGDMLRNPAFPPDALEEYKRQVLSSLETQRKEPEAILETELARYGNPYPSGDVRYAPSFDEMERSTRSLTVEQLKAFHSRFFGAQFGQVALVGDMESAEVRRALETALGDWRSPSPYTRVPNPWVAVKPARLVFKTPDKQNATMQVEQALALADSHVDYAALMLANHMLGAGGSSRLWLRIREKGGLSYDVGSSISWSQHEPNSGWRASAIFAPQNRAAVESAFKEEIAKALKTGFTAQELAQGRAGLLNYRRLARAQDDSLANSLASNLRLQRTLAVSQKVDEQIATLTLEQVNAALRKYLQPDQFVYGFAGDFKD